MDFTKKITHKYYTLFEVHQHRWWGYALITCYLNKGNVNNVLQIMKRVRQSRIYFTRKVYYLESKKN